MSFDRRSIPAEATETLWHASDGWPLRRIDWPATPAARGALLFLGGRGDFYEKYLESLDAWHRAGWQVTALDWRGQGGSGRLGGDDVTGHIDDFATWVDDLAAFWTGWEAMRAGPHVIVAHSMGGHLALRAIAEGRIAPDAAVLCAPMLGLAARVLPAWLMQALAALMCRLGDSRRPAWKWSEKPGQPPAGRQHILTHDAARYADELYWREARPQVSLGPGSWRWVERAYASMRGLFAGGLLEAVRVPLLVIASDDDKLVSFAAILRAAQRIPGARLLRFGKEGQHELLREADPVRDRVMAAIDAFLAEAAPARERK